MITRNYPYNDALMLAGGKVIAASLRCCMKELSEIRSLWTRGYITDLDSRLDNAFSGILGVELPSIYRFLKFDIYESLQHAAFDLSCLKIQIEVDYQDNVENKNEFLSALGFTMFQQRPNMLSEEELIRVLEHFAVNLSPSRRSELVANGVNPFLLDKLAQQAALLNEMGQVQAMLMLPNKKMKEPEIAVLCSLYNEVEGICTIASTFFEKKAKKRELFIFSSVINRLKGLSVGELRAV